MSTRHQKAGRLHDSAERAAELLERTGEGAAAGDVRALIRSHATLRKQNAVSEARLRYRYGVDHARLDLSSLGMGVNGW